MDLEVVGEVVVVMGFPLLQMVWIPLSQSLVAAVVEFLAVWCKGYE